MYFYFLKLLFPFQVKIRHLFMGEGLVVTRESIGGLHPPASHHNATDCSLGGCLGHKILIGGIASPHIPPNSTTEYTYITLQTIISHTLTTYWMASQVLRKDLGGTKL